MLKKVSIANLGFALASAPLLQYITSATGQGGIAECRKCAPGTYQPYVHALPECLTCPAGTYTDEVGSASCQREHLQCCINLESRMLRLNKR